MGIDCNSDSTSRHPIKSNPPSDSAKNEVEKVCRHGDPPNNFGFGHGCELVLSFLCNMHCTNGRLKEQGYSSGVCRLFDVNCYCQC
uniref:Defensin-like protein n=1 Tax=Globodera rostochiensis TaxID=31243 RepID=A0A914H3K6_GLORO